MARKSASPFSERHGDRIREGSVTPIREDVAEIEELDKPEVQAAILRPDTVQVPLDDGEIEVPSKITLGQSFEKRTMVVVEAMRVVLLRAVEELSGDTNRDSGWLSRNSVFIPLVVYKEPVVNVVADFIAMMAKKPVHEIKPRVNSATVSTAFLLALRIISDISAGESQSKKAAVA